MITKLNLTKNFSTMLVADLKQRNSILLTDEAIKKRPGGYSDEQYISWLNFQYQELEGQEIPFHYIVTDNGNIYNAKEDVISTVSSLYAGYENEILVFSEPILISLNVVQEKSIVQLLTLLCKKYSILTQDVVCFPYDILLNNVISSFKIRLRGLIEESLQQNDKREIVKYSFIREQIETSGSASKVQFQKLSDSLTIKELSEMTGIPQSVLLAQNQDME